MEREVKIEKHNAVRWEQHLRGHIKMFWDCLQELASGTFKKKQSDDSKCTDFCLK